MHIQHFYHYDDRYFQYTKHTREELYQLQSIIMDTTYCEDFTKAIGELEFYEEKEINSCLSMYFNEGKINRVQVGIVGKIIIYRYFTK